MSQFYELSSVNMLQDGLNGSSTRQEAIAQNMANVNTPGYKRKEVAFKDSLRQAYIQQNNSGVDLHAGHDRHIQHQSSKPVSPNKFEVSDTSIRNDKNNVDPDRQMAKQAKNSLYFNGLAQFQSKIFSDLNNLVGQLRQA
jgi:flagellar basal-body rod protein FlgB